ncbi:MAG: thiamine phosphate synthase [Verrucomicrobia bacterium]|nr:thiamine phosphate synthase [Verrucomicrobiota bacterium]
MTVSGAVDAAGDDALAARIEHARLYAIVDLAYVAKGDEPAVLERLIAGGVDIVQLRGKRQTLDELTTITQQLLEVTGPASTPLVINDYPEIARRLPVQGVHLGQDDAAIASARACVRRPVVVGKSTHSLEQALAAEREGANYIGFGPLFATPTKPEYTPIGLDRIRELHEKVRIPIFCIGGINIDNLQQVIDAGAKRVVMVSALLRARSILDYVRCATDMLA